MSLFFVLFAQFLAHSLNILILKRGPEKKIGFWLFNLLGAVLTSYVFQLLGILSVVPMYLYQLALFYFTSKKDKDFFYIVPLGLILGIIGDYFANYISLVFIDKIVVGSNTAGATPHLLIAFVIALLLAFAIHTYLRRALTFLPQIMLVGATNLLLWTYYLIIIANQMSDTQENNLKLETVFFVLYSVILLIALYSYSRMLEARFNKKTVEMQKDYIKKLEHSYQELRTFKHDYRNILYTMNTYIEEKDLTGLTDYYQEKILPTSVALEDRPVDLNSLKNLNPLNLRSFLNVKLLEASAKNVKVKLNISENTSIKDVLAVELVEALGIILDNAIEEITLQRLNQPLVVLFETDPNKTTITVKNPTVTTLPLYQLKEQDFSTKGTKRGNGLVILDKIINRNKEFTLNTKLENQAFSQKITITK